MKLAGTCLASAVVLALCGFSGQATSEEKTPPMVVADQLFQAGKFAEAGERYARVMADSPENYSGTLQLGRIALLANRLDDAEDWFKKAIALKPSETDPKVMLAAALYRQDDFSGAAASLNGVDVPSNNLIAGNYPVDVPRYMM